MKKVLLTGFEPFGGESVNPALEASRALETRPYEGFELAVKELPTVFGESLQTLKRLIAEEKPDIVICAGQAGGRGDISIERVALNVNDASISDNAGNRPVDEPVIAGAPAAYWSTLPIKAIVKRLRDAGIPASVSNTAGTFVCNHVFYGLAHWIATEYPHMRGGFVHVPYLPEQAARHPGKPGMSLERIVQGLDIVVRTSVHDRDDITFAAGQTH